MSRDNDAARRAADLAIKNVLEEHGEQANSMTVWRVQGTAVISHRALERIAARVKIRFDMPTILRAERDEAVLLVAGTRGELREWSIGECVVNVNYRVSGKQAAYVYAMAEKRAKDRVILKLLELHGLAYSEEEADDFRARGEAINQGDQPNTDEARREGEPPSRDEDSDAGQREFIDACLSTIRSKPDGKSLREWWQSAEHRTAMADFGLSRDQVDSLKAALTDRLAEIGRASDERSVPPKGRMNGNDHATGRREEARA